MQNIIIKYSGWKSIVGKGYKANYYVCGTVCEHILTEALVNVQYILYKHIVKTKLQFKKDEILLGDRDPQSYLNSYVPVAWSQNSNFQFTFSWLKTAPESRSERGKDVWTMHGKWLRLIHVFCLPSNRPVRALQCFFFKCPHFLMLKPQA